MGVRPTVDDSIKANLEVHLLDREIELYGQHIEVTFRHKLREEQKFGSVDELRENIARDIEIRGPGLPGLTVRHTMSDYKDTLNLPQTAFPMKASLAQREPQRLKQWQEWSCTRRFVRQCRAPQVHPPRRPPYANGELHLGHAVNKILKDIIVKSHTLAGFDAPYVPGWDCHGLPIELNVEKKVGKPGVKISPAEFRQKCREYAARQVDGQRTISCAWAYSATGSTLPDHGLPVRGEYRARPGTIVDNGHLHKGFKPVHWCTDCGSALAEAEVEYQDKISPAIDVAFAALDPAAFNAPVAAVTAARSPYPSGPPRPGHCLPIWRSACTPSWTMC